VGSEATDATARPDEESPVSPAIAARPRRSLSLLIVDDDAGFRRLIRRLVEEESGTTLIAEAADGEEAVRLAHVLQPDVILMDIAMPRLSGLEAIARAKADRPETKIIVVTMHGEEAYRKAALDRGADAFVLKKALSRELLPTIRRVVA
jgi:DNA-binding NarL/FixJ family response regulator